MIRESVSVPEDSSIRSIRYLSCQGGGMKGVGDVGAIEALEEYGVLAQIEEVAGSSAGGLIATLLAIGCSPKEIREFMLELDFKAFQDKKEAGWLESTVLGKAEKMSKMEDIAKLAFGKELGIWEGDALRYCLAEKIALKTGNPNITFRELEALTNIEGSPYKKLTLTGTNITEKKLEYYNAQNTPDMPIVLAARISASFPGAFKPVIVDGNVKVDGGLLDNLPSIFHQEPYVKREDLNEFGGNSQAFALIFDTEADRKAVKLERGYHLPKALFDTKMSEEESIKKYGGNVAKIDTGDVGTLDFSLPMSKKQELIDAGKSAVRGAFEVTLAKEAKIGAARYINLNIQDLIRIETDMRFEIKSLRSQEQPIPHVLTDKLGKITIEIERRNIDPILLAEERDLAEKRHLKKVKKQENREFLDGELSTICEEKYQELIRSDRANQEKIRQLDLAKKALELERAIIIDAFKDNGKKNKCAEMLVELKHLEDQIKEYREYIVVNREKGDSENAKKYKEFLVKRKAKYQEIIQYYTDNNQEALARFFRDMEKDSHHAEFEMPYTASEIFHYCSIDIDSCQAKIEDCVRLSEQNQETAAIYREHKSNFLKKETRGERYQALMQLKKELDHSIHRNSMFLTKLNNYLAQKAPRFRGPISRFMKAVVVVAYITWVPLAAPVGLVALACKKMSPDQDVVASADKILQYFKMSNIKTDTKCRLFRNKTVALIKKIDEAYNNIDKNGANDDFVLTAAHMKELRLEFKDILARHPGESRKLYQERVKKFNEVFDKMCQVEHISLKQDSLSNEGLDSLRKSIISDMHHAQTHTHSHRSDLDKKHKRSAGVVRFSSYSVDSDNPKKPREEGKIVRKYQVHDHGKHKP